MPDVFGNEGPQGAKPDDKKKPKKPAGRGEPDMLHGSMDPRAGESPRGRHVMYDNESGEIHVDLPPRFAKYRRELEEDLMEEFYGEPAGAADSQRTIDAWIREWMDRKTKEDPGLLDPGPANDAL